LRWPGKSSLRLSRRQRGFTLIETVVALGILGAIGVSFVAALNTSARLSRNLDEDVQAANLATAYVEAIKESPYAATYPNAGDGIYVPPQYSVTIDMAYSNDGGDTWVYTYTDETFQRITILVSREGRPVLSLCTYRSQR
jgi:prepilin-type N-terminal cleavage/methylation domain-containing protein